MLESSNGDCPKHINSSYIKPLTKSVAYPLWSKEQGDLSQLILQPRLMEYLQEPY